MYDHDQEKQSFGCPHITEEDVERIAERAATKAVSVYIEVGKSVLKRVLWLTGAAIVGVAAWLHSKGFI